MKLLEGSDALLRFKIKQIQDWVVNRINFADYDAIQLVVKFADGRIVFFLWVPEDNLTYSICDFSIFSEFTKGKVGSCTADIRWIKGVKRVRFNSKTIKWKVLPSVKVP